VEHNAAARPEFPARNSTEHLLLLDFLDADVLREFAPEWALLFFALSPPAAGDGRPVR